MPISRVFAALRSGTYEQFSMAERPGFRRIALSLLEMAAITGVLLRAYRALALTHGSSSWAYYAITMLVGAIFLFGMLTIHLSHFQVKQWLWRVPAFAVAEAVTEMLTSLILIALGREPWGTVRADFHDWPFLAADILGMRMLALCVFGLVLAGVVQWVRYAMLRHQHRL